ncbi:unnamed protein product [Parnassius apollo]|uniref:(apollo) hypothetical protein n=1 Tax=Parnassius apollo TaxID=110799 RepID=A0A8S3WPW5_PARAO|nr:unnamed protein product [Parnassius apollo]
MLPPQTLSGTDKQLPLVLICDEAYPLKEYLTRPYPQRNLDHNNKVFNEKLSRAGKSVECAFRILCAKWRILNKPTETNVKHARLTIKTACLLHNIIMSKDIYACSAAISTHPPRPHLVHLTQKLCVRVPTSGFHCSPRCHCNCTL